LLALRYLDVTIPMKVRAHLADPELPHATELNICSMLTVLQLEVYSRDAGKKAEFCNNITC